MPRRRRSPATPGRPVSRSASSVAATAPGTVSAAGNWWGSVAPADVQSRAPAASPCGPWCVDAACSALSNNADLTSLSLSAGALSPVFGSSTTSYTASVGDGVDAVTATGIAHPGAASSSPAEPA